MKQVPTKALVIISLTVLWLGRPDRLAAQTAGVLREVYSGIGGTTVADLTNNVNFPNNPSAQEVLAEFEAPTDVAEDYGQRLTAYVVPPNITQLPTNFTVLEGSSPTFSVQLARAFGAAYQWLRNDSNIPSGTNSSYTLSPVALGDSGAQFRCYIVNPQGNTNSSTAILTVQADTTPPTISSVGNLGDNTIVTVLFSEPVEAASGTNRLNYTLNNGAAVNAAEFGADSQSVVLTTSPLSPGIVYILTVNNVSDRASTPHTIDPGTQPAFSIDFSTADV